MFLILTPNHSKSARHASFTCLGQKRKRLGHIVWIAQSPSLLDL